MRITYEREEATYVEKPNHPEISVITIGDNCGKIATVYPKNHAELFGKVSKIFDILEQAKKEIGEVLNEGK